MTDRTYVDLIREATRQLRRKSEPPPRSAQASPLQHTRRTESHLSHWPPPQHARLHQTLHKPWKEWD